MALSDKQIAAAEALADGKPIKDALALAGYSAPVHHERSGREMKDRVRRSVESKLSLELVPRALSLYRQVLNDEQAPLKVRVAVAKDVFDRGGFVPPKAAEASALPSLEDMTRDELVAFINQANDRRAALATDVSTSDDAAVDKQLADMLE